MTSVNQFWRRAKLPLAVSLASSLAGPAFGVSFNVGEIEGQFDSSLSIGASWSTQSPNKNLIGVNNGGHGLSQTSDDGHANYFRSTDGNVRIKNELAIDQFLFEELLNSRRTHAADRYVSKERQVNFAVFIDADPRRQFRDAHCVDIHQIAGI